MSQLILPRRLREGRALVGPRNQRGFLINPYRFGGGGPPPASLYSEIIADSPVHYWRNAEASGSVMVDEITTDGSYISTVSLGNPAIYPGPSAPTCAGGNFTSGRFGTSSVTPPALNAMTLVSVVKLTGTSGTQPTGPQRDDNAGGRKYQFRSNGTSLEFVKIVSGVATITQTGVFTAGAACIIAITIDSSGNYVMYKNGASIKTGAIAAANYGGAGDQWQIGYSTGMGAALNGYTCENAVFATALSGARMAAYATAAGL